MDVCQKTFQRQCNTEIDGDENSRISDDLMIHRLLAAPTWMWGHCGRHNSPPTSSVMDVIFCRSDVYLAWLAQSIHICFGLPRFLPGGTISRVFLPDVVFVSPLYVAKPPQSCFRTLLCDILYLQSLPDVIVSHMVSLCVSACPSAYLHFCHFQFLHVGASHWYCLHPVQHSRLNDIIVDISFSMWWYSLIAYDT